MCISKSTISTFLPELAKILAILIVENVFPSPGCIEVIKNDLKKFVSFLDVNKKFIDVLMALKDSTKLSFDLIFISMIRLKFFKKGIPPKTGTVVESANSFTC